MKLFLTTLEQAGILLLFILLGYFFRKKNVINDSGRKVLASLLVNLFAPCYIAMSLSQVVNISEISKYLSLLLAGVLVTLGLIFLAIPFAKIFGKDKHHQNILKYAFAFGNIGYFGYPLIFGVFGAVARAQMILFCLPMSIAIYSYGYYILTTPASELEVRKERSFAQKVSFLYSPQMISAYLGITLGILQSGLNFKLPNFIETLLTSAGNCQSVPAMLITGSVLANIPFGKLFTSVKSYFIGLVRLLVFPLAFAVVFAILYLCGWQNEMFARVAFITIISVSLPVGMNVVVYPESAGLDSTEGAKTCFVSYILALVTLPVVFTIAQNLLNVTF